MNGSPYGSLHIPNPILVGFSPKTNPNSGNSYKSYNDNEDVTDMDIVKEIIRLKPKITVVRKFFKGHLKELDDKENNNPVFQRSFC